MLEKCKGDLLEVKDGQSKTQPFLLENLVYFVEVSLSPLRIEESAQLAIENQNNSFITLPSRPFVSSYGCLITVEASSGP